MIAAALCGSLCGWLVAQPDVVLVLAGCGGFAWWSWFIEHRPRPEQHTGPLVVAVTTKCTACGRVAAHARFLATQWQHFEIEPEYRVHRGCPRAPPLRDPPVTVRIDIVAPGK